MYFASTDDRGSGCIAFDWPIANSVTLIWHLVLKILKCIQCIFPVTLKGTKTFHWCIIIVESEKSRWLGKLVSSSPRASKSLRNLKEHVINCPQSKGNKIYIQLVWNSSILSMMIVIYCQWLIFTKLKIPVYHHFFPHIILTHQQI